jgi:hypothetical protein
MRVIKGIKMIRRHWEVYACSEGIAVGEGLYIANIQFAATDCLVVSREIKEGCMSSYGSILKEIAERRWHISDSRRCHAALPTLTHKHQQTFVMAEGFSNINDSRQWQFMSVWPKPLGKQTSSLSSGT